MALSIFELFRIGIGPSSSHTVGPMRAAAAFVHGLARTGQLARCARLQVQLYGSLAATGRGHASDTAILPGLAGLQPETVDPDEVGPCAEAMRRSACILLGGVHPIAFDVPRDLLFLPAQLLPHHSNGMQFSAFDAAGGLLAQARSYSVGGGFVVPDEEVAASRAGTGGPPLPLGFGTGRELLAIADAPEWAAGAA